MTLHAVYKYLPARTYVRPVGLRLLCYFFSYYSIPHITLILSINSSIPAHYSLVISRKKSFNPRGVTGTGPGEGLEPRLNFPILAIIVAKKVGIANKTSVYEQEIVSCKVFLRVETFNKVVMQYICIQK